MNQIGFGTLTYVIKEHWVSAFLLLVSFTTFCLALMLRWYVRRRIGKLLENGFEEDHELDLLPAPGTFERESLEFIARTRQEIWSLPEAELQIGLEAFNRHALKIVRAIGAIYHPEAAQPEYEASLSDSLELVTRVSARLARLASTIPIKYVGSRKLSDFQRYYQTYVKINENPVLQLFKKNPHIYKAARLAWNVKNAANPFYWAGRELTREGYFIILRWFYLTFTSEIGKEAMRLYSGKRFQHEEDRDAVLICYRLFHTMRKWSGPTSAEWAAFVQFVTGLSALDSESKLHVLARCSEDRLPKDLEERTIATKSGIKWYKKGLKALIEAEPGTSPAKARLVEKETETSEEAG
jgi:hypothetical protein